MLVALRRSCSSNPKFSLDGSFSAAL